jgi:hypothetical protein
MSRCNCSHISLTAVTQLLNPLSLMMEDLGFFSPAFDEVAIKAMTAT